MPKPSKSDPGPDQIPLDITIPASRPRTNSELRRTTVPSFATAQCPTHSGGKRTGLTLSAKHLVWKVHYVVLGNGTAVPCRSSGVRLCECLPEDRKMYLSLTKAKFEADPMHGVREAKCFHKLGESQ